MTGKDMLNQLMELDKKGLLNDEQQVYILTPACIHYLTCEVTTDSDGDIIIESA
jgi:hypothetical protein